MTRGRYSKYLRPISIISDWTVLILLSSFFFRNFTIPLTAFIFYQIFVWSFIAYSINFYEVFRFTKPSEIISLLIKQLFLFSLLVMAFFSVTKDIIDSLWLFIYFISTSFIFITTCKLLLYYYLKRYRAVLGKNYRNTIIIGCTQSAINLKKLFQTRLDYGYRFQGFFSDKKSDIETLGNISQIENYVLENNIDDVYCALKELDDEQLKKLLFFADNNNITLKFIPESNEIYAKNLKIDYYEFFPVLSIKESPLNDSLFLLIKRLFDIVFSLLFIVFIISWIAPILALLIKLESKGPVIFKQKRNGLNFHEFYCYKFRSMSANAGINPATEGDERVTKIGKFMRKTSLDELPQYFNVLFGDMSVVGPRPHEPSYNEMYTKIAKMDRFMKRHIIKPGITGLAQVKGYRGEVKVSNDIVNRVRLDLFYIENWSLFLDLKIIFQTIIILIKGQEKAY
jgi:putative colanic acid biosysnthesis UDP-glucose lipid carrier transferase